MVFFGLMLDFAMRMFRSFIFRLALILSITGSICLLLMSITLGIQGLNDGMVFTSTLFGIVFTWFLANLFIVRKIDPELSMEVARLLLPAGAILSILLSGVLSMFLDGMIPGTEGKQHFILYFVGAGVAVFLVIRCFDIKWLRGEEEISLLEERTK